MKRKLISAFLCTIMSLSFAGCRFIDGFKEGVKAGAKKANNETTVDGKKDTTEGEFKVDWKKCIEDTKTELTNPENFNYVKEIDIKVEEKKITFTATLADATSSDVALDFADTIIRRFNANAQVQDGSIKGEDKDYLGGIYDVYDISMGVAP